MEVFEYNDRIGRRGRRPEILVYTSDKVYMGVQDVPRVVSFMEKDYQRDGKWSNTTYLVSLAKGVQASIVREDFNSGKFFPDTCMTWASVGKALGLEGVSPLAVEEAVRANWPRHAARFDLRRAAIQELESQAPSRSVVFRQRFHTNRIGRDVLLVDGELFLGESISGKVVVLSAEDNGQGGRYKVTTYTLEVAEGTTLEFLTEGGFPGDDSLEDRGWVRDGDNWIKPQTPAGGGQGIDLSALSLLNK